MMVAHLLHASVHLIVPSGVSIRLLFACSACANPAHWAPHFAPPSHVQASCLERARPAAVSAFPGALAARAAAAPGHHGRERMREAGVQGKIEGCGTTVRAKPVCTWVGSGTLPMAASCRQLPQRLASAGNLACLTRLGAMALDGAAP